MTIIHQSAIQAANAYIKSGLLSDKIALEITGGLIRHATEFIDIYGLLDESSQSLLCPLIHQQYYSDQRQGALVSENLFVDFFSDGLSHSISPHPLVDLQYMRDIRPDVMTEQISGSAFLWLLSRDVVNPSPFFDLTQLDRKTNGVPASTSLLLDYLLLGEAAGPFPSVYLNVDEYQSRYTDVPRSRIEAAIHFCRVGDAEGRVSSKKFDPKFYRSEYGTENSPVQRPLHHYLSYGQFAGRFENAIEHQKQNISSKSRSSVLGSSFAYAPTADSTQENYLEVLAAVEIKRQKRIDDFQEHSILPVMTDDPDDLLTTLSFDRPSDPLVEILIPCYNEFKETVECLAAIALINSTVPLVVTLIDDCSTDDRFDQFRHVPGLNYHRNERNLHFLTSCNGAYTRGSTPYVYLLNNDAQVVGDTLDQLFHVLDEDSEIGASVSMILYPNGRLQEAGCTIDATGETKMIGSGENPDQPQYTCDKDILYGSGAGLMVRRAAVGDTLFDERFAPAYCEDSDLCIRLRNEGWRIRYVGSARLVHHLSVSTGKASEITRVQMARKNQQKLYEKWGRQLADDLKLRVLAYYLPQYHPFKENDFWWGKGFTEWTNVSKAVASFDGHYQPRVPADMGYYDLRLVEVMEQQQRLARRYGIHGFVMYYYNFQGKRLMERPLKNLIEKGNADFNFCLCWANENWTKHWDGGSSEHSLMQQDYGNETLESFANDAIAAAQLSSYITVGGKPMLQIYRPLLIPNIQDTCSYLRERFLAAGFNGLYLVYVESMEAVTAGIEPLAIGFDASVEFPPQGIAEPYSKPIEPLKGSLVCNLYDYTNTVVNAITREQPGYKRLPGVFPSWDNTPRQPNAHTTLVDAYPEKFQAYIEQKLAYLDENFQNDERLLFVNAWNEWAEGAYLEPDQVFGHDWLRAVSDSMTDRMIF